jgi:hypothetical protein
MANKNLVTLSGNALKEMRSFLLIAKKCQQVYMFALQNTMKRVCTAQLDKKLQQGIKMTQGKKDHLWHSIACLSLLFFTSLALSGVAAWLDLLKIYNDDDHTLIS